MTKVTNSEGKEYFKFDDSKMEGIAMEYCKLREISRDMLDYSQGPSCYPFLKLKNNRIRLEEFIERSGLSLEDIQEAVSYRLAQIQ